MIHRGFLYGAVHPPPVIPGHVVTVDRVCFVVAAHADGSQFYVEDWPGYYRLWQLNGTKSGTKIIKKPQFDRCRVCGHQWHNSIYA